MSEQQHPAESHAPREAWAEVTPTGLDVEPTGTVEVSIEALRALCVDADVSCPRCPASPSAVAASTGTSVDVEPPNVIQHIVDAWDCCGTCAGEVLAGYVAAREAAARAAEREALVVLDGLLHRWETVPALRRATAAAEVRRTLGEHLARAAREGR